MLWTTNEYSTFSAEDDVGAHWSGAYATQHPFSAFDWCWDTGQAVAKSVGMRLVTVTTAAWPWKGTINLV